MESKINLNKQFNFLFYKNMSTISLEERMSKLEDKVTSLNQKLDLIEKLQDKYYELLSVEIKRSTDNILVRRRLFHQLEDNISILNDKINNIRIITDYL